MPNEGIVFTRCHDSLCLAITKSFIAPIKYINILRLVLMAAVLSRDMFQVTRRKIDMPSIIYNHQRSILDGQPGGFWYIKNESKRFKAFVAN